MNSTSKKKQETLRNKELLMATLKVSLLDCDANKVTFALMGNKTVTIYAY